MPSSSSSSSGLYEAENLPPMIVSRVMKDLRRLMRQPPAGVHVHMNDENLSVVVADIEGPAQTPFEGGMFRVKLALGRNFPKMPPKAYFVTKIFHPNVSSKGEICVNTLKKDWKSTHGIEHVLVVIRCLLIYPNPDSALNEDAGKLLREDYEDFARRARMMTRIHAKPKLLNGSGSGSGSGRTLPSRTSSSSSSSSSASSSSSSSGASATTTSSTSSSPANDDDDNTSMIARHDDEDDGADDGRGSSEGRGKKLSRGGSVGGADGGAPRPSSAENKTAPNMDAFGLSLSSSPSCSSITDSPSGSVMFEKLDSSSSSAMELCLGMTLGPAATAASTSTTKQKPTKRRKLTRKKSSMKRL